MRPGTGERDVEMVAARYGFEAAIAACTRHAIRRDPVAKMRILADEAATGRLCVVPLVPPDAVDQKAHCSFPLPQLLSCREGFCERKQYKSAMRRGRRWIRR